MAIARERMTLEEFLKVPEEEPPLELFGGEVAQKLIGHMWRSAIMGHVAMRVEMYAHSRNLGRAFTSLRCSHSGVSTVLDVAYFVRERVPRDATGHLLEDALIPPDIAAEIVSPGQSVTDLLLRCLWYVANGVKISILIDPHRRSVVLFRPGTEPIALRDTGTLDLGDVIPEFALDLADLFAALHTG
jgi:Uma2 family endonuclease